MVFAHLWNAGKPSTTVFVYFWNAGRVSTTVFACSCEFPRFSPQNDKSAGLPSEKKRGEASQRRENKKDAHGDIVFAVRVLICEDCPFLKKTSPLYPPRNFPGEWLLLSNLFKQ